jgi:hypothetical protein
MLRLRLVVAVLLVCLLGTGWLMRDNTRADDLPRIRGTLPAHFGKLGLSDEQKQKVYRIQKTYRDQINELTRKLKELKDKRKEAYEKVLTPDQIKRLRELRTGEKAKEPETKKDKKARKDKEVKKEPARTKDK